MYRDSYEAGVNTRHLPLPSSLYKQTNGKKLKAVYVNDLIATSNANGLKVTNNVHSQT